MWAAEQTWPRRSFSRNFIAFSIDAPGRVAAIVVGWLLRKYTRAGEFGLAYGRAALSPSERCLIADGKA
jgi:hypothetical protein